LRPWQGASAAHYKRLTEPATVPPHPKYLSKLAHELSGLSKSPADAKTYRPAPVPLDIYPLPIKDLTNVSALLLSGTLNAMNTSEVFQENNECEFMQSATEQLKTEETDSEGGNLTLWQVICSVFAAGFGVQSKENKVRDFSRGKPLQFIAAGLLFTIAFLVILITLVNVIV
jgi:hypothetical protein